MAAKTKATRGKKVEANSEELREQILKVAGRHFADHGFQGASLKSIAEEAGVAGSLINYHFQDKAGLFERYIAEFGADRHDAIKRILNKPETQDEMKVRIQLFVEEMIASVCSAPHNYEILNREMRSGNPAVLDAFEKTILTTFQVVVDFFEHAKKAGLVRAEADSAILAGSLFACSSDSACKDHLSKRFMGRTLQDPQYRKTYCTNIVDLFMQGVSK